MTNVETKRCWGCKEDRLLTEFDKSSNGMCKTCRVEYRKQPKQRAKQTINRMKHKGMSINLTTHDIAWTLGDCRCSYCGIELEYADTTLDHITPLDRQGPNTFANTTVACRSCNSRKGSQPALLFMLTECEPYYNRKLLEQIALRSGQSVADVYAELVIDAQRYFAEHSAQAVTTT